MIPVLRLFETISIKKIGGACLQVFIHFLGLKELKACFLSCCLVFCLLLGEVQENFHSSYLGMMS